MDRALIIAIENYEKVTGGFTAKKLDGTLEAAKAFRACLEEKWQREGISGRVLFCSEPILAGERGASSQDVIDALVTIQQEGRDATDNLFVYFSGHGFRARGETIKLADVLVCADFVDNQRSTASCFKLDALIAGLRESLGPGCHYYFIDACRNEVPKAVLSNIMPFDARGSEDPSVFVLQSTAAGAPALVGGPFAKTLVRGLRGAGKAKVWEPPITDSMKVRFDSLRKFLKDTLQDVQPITQTTSGEKGESDAILATIKPVAPATLTLTLQNYPPDGRGTAKVAVFGGAETVYDITGASVAIQLPPNYYKVTVAVNMYEVAQAGPIDVDLYDDRELTLTVKPAVRSSPRGILRDIVTTRNTVCVSLPTDTELVMRHVDTGHESTFDASACEKMLPPGAYRAAFQKRHGPIISVKEVTVAPATTTNLAPASWQGDVARESIARHFPQRDDGIDFSESLGGALADPDVAVWLSIIGGGRIIGSRGDFSKIAPLPLVDFSHEPPEASPIYVLAALPDPAARLNISIAPLAAPTVWMAAMQPPTLDGVREAVIRGHAGQRFVSMVIDQQPAYTLATVASPNRCTLIVLTLDEDGQPRVSQFVLPIGHLTIFLHPDVQQRLGDRNQLRDVHVLALLSRAFRKRRRIDDEFKEHELEQLLRSKWLDPIGASLATYEHVRRNGERKTLEEVAVNMGRFFGDIPDAAAIQRLSGLLKNAPPRGVPLFLDGLRAFADDEIALPYPRGLLDFTGPWTAWRGAVAADDSRIA